MHDLRLQPASVQDLDFIFRLQKATMYEYVDQLWGWDDEEQRAYLLERFDPARESLIFLADQKIGVMATEERATEIFLSKLYILPEYQRQGIGSELLLRLLGVAAVRGLPVTLRVMKNNPARRLYERLGFVVTGETEVQYWMRCTAHATPPVSRFHALLLLATTGLTFLLVVLGGVVCVTDASGGCPDWPTCYGRFVPPLRVDSVLEFAHRLLAAVTSLAVVASALLGWRRPRAGQWVSRPPQLAVFFLIVVSALGALTVLRGLSPLAAALDLGSALVLLALMVVATVVALLRRRHPGLAVKLAFRGTFARLALWTLLLVLLTLVAGIFAAPANPRLRCLGWPSYADIRLGLEAGTWPHLARWVGACLAGFSILAVALQAWCSQREALPVLRATAVVGVLFSAASTLGLASQAFGFPQSLGIAHVVLAAGLWSSLVVLVTLAGPWAK